MVASYISTRFEKRDLNPTVAAIRCITRNLDDGATPPAPSLTYRPTSPDTLRECFVLEYVNDTLGERFSRVATLSEITTLPVRALDSFEAFGADFISAGVAPGDVLQVTPPNTAVWDSEEYPATPYYFTVQAVISAERLVLTSALPGFQPSLTWAIAGKTSGSFNGFPRRSGFPAVNAEFRDSRSVSFFTTVAALDAYVESTKTALDALSRTSTTSTLTSEDYSTP